MINLPIEILTVHFASLSGIPISSSAKGEDVDPEAHADPNEIAILFISRFIKRLFPSTLNFGSVHTGYLLTYSV